jgi:mono/diheme cytochrome c family protein
MKKIVLAIALLLAPSVVYAWPWSDDMANQVSFKAQESVDPNNPGMTPFPKRSVPVAGTTVRVTDMGAAREMQNPIPVDEKSVAIGGYLFNIYCAACHGKSGTGDGLVGEKLLLRPWDLTSGSQMHSWDPAEYPDGYIFGYISLGGAIMPSYANDLSATERWHVVNYIRKELQGQAAVTTAQEQ